MFVSLSPTASGVFSVGSGGVLASGPRQSKGRRRNFPPIFILKICGYFLAPSLIGPTTSLGSASNRFQRIDLLIQQSALSPLEGTPPVVEGVAGLIPDPPDVLIEYHNFVMSTWYDVFVMGALSGWAPPGSCRYPNPL